MSAVVATIREATFIRGVMDVFMLENGMDASVATLLRTLIGRCVEQPIWRARGVRILSQSQFVRKAEDPEPASWSERQDTDTETVRCGHSGRASVDEVVSNKEAAHFGSAP